MRRFVWHAALLMSLCSGGAYAMEGGDFAPPVVVLDRDGTEVTVDIQGKSPVLLILFEA